MFSLLWWVSLLWAHYKGIPIDNNFLAIGIGFILIEMPREKYSTTISLWALWDSRFIRWWRGAK